MGKFLKLVLETCKGYGKKLRIPRVTVGCRISLLRFCQAPDLYEIGVLSFE